MNSQSYRINKPFPSREFLAFSIVMLIILSIVVTMPLVGNDFFPYLRIGDEIIRTGRIPTTEFMTYTQFGNPASYPHWLFSLIFLGVYRAGGVALTAIFSMLLVGIFYLFLWISMRNEGISVLTSMIIMLYVALIHAEFFVIRPQLLTYPLLGFLVFIITRYIKDENRFLWYLPIITFMWVNFHGSFIIIFLILIPALIFSSGDRKRLLVFIAISLIASFLNYYSIGAWRHIFSTVNNELIQSYITEWQPPVNQGFQMNLFFAGLLIVPVLLAMFKQKIKIIYWIWFLGFGWMALTSRRYLIWFLPFLAMILSKLIDPLVKRYNLKPDRFQNHSLNLLFGIILLFFPLTLLPGVRHRWIKDSPPVYYHITPIEATEWIKQNSPLPDNIWADFNYACYFAFELPQNKIFLTYRIQEISNELLTDYIQITNAVYTWPSLLDKYRINTLVLNIEDQKNLIKAVVSSQEWEEIYHNQKTIIYVREDKH